MDVIFTLLGVPEGDRHWLRERMDLSLERDRDTPVLPQRALVAMAEMIQFWVEFVKALRRRPNDGLVAALLDAEVEGDDGTPSRLSDGEIVGFCSLLGAAGNETVTASGERAFAATPGSTTRFTHRPGAIPDPSRGVGTTPSQYQDVHRDVEWHGRTVPKGSRILLLTGSANRDERIRRSDRRRVRRLESHLALGYGIHFCLGALARSSRVTLEEFSRRFARIGVDESRCVRVHMSNVHGYESVPFWAA
jgi:cytochrome P450